MHAIVLDGVMVNKSTGREKFVTIPAPTNAKIENLLQSISEKLLRYLRGLGPRKGQPLRRIGSKTKSSEWKP